MSAITEHDQDGISKTIIDKLEEYGFTYRDFAELDLTGLEEGAEYMPKRRAIAVLLVNGIFSNTHVDSLVASIRETLNSENVQEYDKIAVTIDPNAEGGTQVLVSLYA